MTTTPSKTAEHGVDAVLKRVFDVLVAFVISLLLLPLIVVLAALVALTSPGGAFFRQQRVGRDGELFWLYKFRSMRRDTTGIAVTSGNDARITPIGRVLRKSKLDELPQFWNVLKGEMSLVGPRPEVPRYVAHYTDAQRTVLSVRPGITGAAQLEFRDEEQRLVGVEDVEAFYLTHLLPEKLAIDLRYVRQRSFVGDLKILIRAVGAIFL